MADSLLNEFVASGTTAERTAFTPTPPTPASGPDPGYTWFDTDDGILYSWDGAAWAAPGGGLSASIYLQYQDQKTQNTAGGTFTSGSWQTRVLNTEVADAGGLGTLASNQITLTAGTYYVSASAPTFVVDRHQLRLQNVTDATTILTGPSNFVDAGISVTSTAVLTGVFTIAASKAIELQHRCQTTRASNGLGVESNFTTEIYATIEFWKIG